MCGGFYASHIFTIKIYYNYLANVILDDLGLQIIFKRVEL